MSQFLKLFFFSCGSVHVEPPCKLESNPSLPYPQCCPTPVCEADTVDVSDIAQKDRDMPQNVRDLTQTYLDLSENEGDLSENEGELSQTHRPIPQNVRELSQTYNDLSENEGDLSENENDLNENEVSRRKISDDVIEESVSYDVSLEDGPVAFEEVFLR